MKRLSLPKNNRDPRNELDLTTDRQRPDATSHIDAVVAVSAACLLCKSSQEDMLSRCMPPFPNHAINPFSKLTLRPRIDPSLRLRRAIHASDPLLVSRILHSHPRLLHNPDTSPTVPNGPLRFSTGLSNTSLHLASSLGLVPVIKVLLSLHHEKEGISLNEDHQTPLMLASRAGHTDAVHLLCTAFPAAIPKRDIRGRDAIIFASEGGHDTCLQILLTFAPGGPEECLRNKDVDGNTALHYASSNGHLLVLRTLLAAGADSEVRNVWSWTPVAYSATVQAEVYFKGLVGEVERRRVARRQAEERGTGGGVRIVGDGEE